MDVKLWQLLQSYDVTLSYYACKHKAYCVCFTYVCTIEVHNVCTIGTVLVHNTVCTCTDAYCVYTLYAHTVHTSTDVYCTYVYSTCTYVHNMYVHMHIYIHIHVVFS